MPKPDEQELQALDALRGSPAFVRFRQYLRTASRHADSAAIMSREDHPEVMRGRARAFRELLDFLDKYTGDLYGE